MAYSRLVSVIVPTHNSAATLEACLQSVINQTYQSIELIVVDNHSTDKTKEIANQYTHHVYVRGPERSAQRNFGVSKASGEYVAIIDSDMELSPDVITQCVEQAMRAACLSVIIPEESFGQGFWAQCKRLERSFYIGIDWMEAARFFSRDTYLKIGGYDETLISGEDWDLSERARGIGQVSHITALIYHNEGQLRLGRLLRKKYYYSQKIDAYKRKSSQARNVKSQMSPFRRYGLFFGQPATLLRQPLIGLGMLFMKTCEFSVGTLGYLVALLHYADRQARP